MKRQNAVRMAWIYCGNVLMGIVPIQPRQSVEQAVRRENDHLRAQNQKLIDTLLGVVERRTK